MWRHCDGRRTEAELAELLHADSGLPADEELVRLALNRLDRAHLLTEPLMRVPVGSGLSRRQVIRSLGLAGGLALLVPAVESIAAPLPGNSVSPQFRCCNYQCPGTQAELAVRCVAASSACPVVPNCGPPQSILILDCAACPEFGPGPLV